MRWLAPFLSTALLAASAPLAAQDQPESGKKLAVGCIYGRVSYLDRPALVAFIKGGFEARTAEERALRQKVGIQVSECRKKYGWGDKREQLGIQYMSGRILRSDAQYHLKDHGVDYAHFDAAVAALTPAQRAAFLQGRFDGEMYEAVAATMIAGGARLAGLEGAALQTAAQYVSQGIQATLLAEEARAGY
jgi:hypothetical protein